MTHAMSGTLYAVLLAVALMACPEKTDGPPTGDSRPVATITALVVVGLPSLVQLTLAPWLLERLQRDWAQISFGELWRVVTSLVVQDGGLLGTAFNLVSLAVVGLAAERVWGWQRWLVLALGAGISAQFWGWVVQPTGGGNSVAVFGLAASIAVLGVRSDVRSRRIAGIVCLLASGLLLAVGDIHGGAAAVGAITAAALTRSPGRRRVFR